jgi:regulator of sigma E protease
VHEWGHYLTARLFNIKIKRFAIGFGKPIKRIVNSQGTEFVLGIIPFGGYVKLLDTREDSVPLSDQPFAFDKKPIWQRACLVVAGSLCNFVLAGVLVSAVLTIGVIQFKPIIGDVKLHSIAANAGVMSGQQIIAVDGHPMTGWQSVLIALLERVGDTESLQLIVWDPATQHNLPKTLSLVHWQISKLNPGPLESLGITPYTPPVPAILGQVDAQGYAAKAGLREGDRITQVNNHPVVTWKELKDVFGRYQPNGVVTLRVERHGKSLTIPLKLPQPAFYELHYNALDDLDVKSIPMHWPANKTYREQYPWYYAISVAFLQVADFATFNLIMLGKLLLGKISLVSLGGPISLLEGAFLALGQGILVFMGFCALISVSLGVVNLLPIPGLDGGQLLFLLIEKIRNKPVSLPVQILAHRLALIALVVFMIQISMNDLLRLVI